MPIFKLAAVVVLAIVLSAHAADEPDRARYLAEQTELLEAAGIDTSTAGLILFLQALPPDPTKLARVPQLVTELAADKFEVRERASQQLKLYGELARPALTAALQSKDLETAWRAKYILAELDSGEALEQRRASSP
jgi:HEAT repeat protein